VISMVAGSAAVRLMDFAKLGDKTGLAANERE
jgi:hypothetical protein